MVAGLTLTIMVGRDPNRGGGDPIPPEGPGDVAEHDEDGGGHGRVERGP